jgi:hypothetical protein
MKALLAWAALSSQPRKPVWARLRAGLTAKRTPSKSGDAIDACLSGAPTAFGSAVPPGTVIILSTVSVANILQFYSVSKVEPLWKLSDACRINLYPVGTEPGTKVPHATLRG